MLQVDVIFYMNNFHCAGTLHDFDDSDEYARYNVGVKVFIDDGQIATYYIDKNSNIWGSYHLHYHRIGGPAWIDLDDGEITWWFNNLLYEDVTDYCEKCGFDSETSMFWILKYGEWLPKNIKDV